MQLLDDRRYRMYELLAAPVVGLSYAPGARSGPTPTTQKSPQTSLGASEAPPVDGRGLFASANLHAPPLHVVTSHAVCGVSGAILAALERSYMQDRASELRRIPLLRTSVNRAHSPGRLWVRFLPPLLRLRALLGRLKIRFGPQQSGPRLSE